MSHPAQSVNAQSPLSMLLLLSKLVDSMDGLARGCSMVSIQLAMSSVSHLSLQSKRAGLPVSENRDNNASESLAKASALH